MALILQSWSVVAIEKLNFETDLRMYFLLFFTYIYSLKHFVARFGRTYTNSILLFMVEDLTCKKLGNHHCHPYNKIKLDKTKTNDISYMLQKTGGKLPP